MSLDALERIFNHVNKGADLNAKAFVSATGSAGTIAAGDHLKEKLNCQIGAIEALETRLEEATG